MTNTNFLYYDKIDIPEGVDVNKTGTARECIICHYWIGIIQVIALSFILSAMAVMIYR